MTKKNSKRKKYRRLAYAFEHVLAYYGFTETEYRVIGQQIRMFCPIHHGDNNSAFVWRGEYGCWTCYTQRCHTLYGNGPYGFILAMEGGDIERAEKITRYLVTEHKDIILSRSHERSEYTARITHGTQKPATEIAQSRFMYSTYPIERGIPRDIQSRYKIGIYEDLYPDRIGFPVFDKTGRIVGITLRALHIADHVPKWLHRPDGYKSGINLYNIHRATPHNGTMILTEGPIDVLKLVVSGISNVVASFGCHLSGEQIDLLKQVGAHRVILAYDNDKAGNSGTQEAARLLRLHGMDVEKLVLANGYNDFGDAPLCHIRSRNWALEKIS